LRQEKQFYGKVDAESSTTVTCDGGGRYHCGRIVS